MKLKMFLSTPGLFRGLAGFIFATVLAGCATNPVSGKSDIVLMSEAQEITLGKKSHQQILKQYGVYDDAKLQAMVNRVGQKLAAQSHRANLKFTFTVLDSPDVNAFALPGGYVYITRGIMAYLNSEEELAGVVGHEIGHVTARHGVKQQTAQTASGLIGVLAAVATGNADIAKGTNVLGTALVRGYGRKHELQADSLGAEYLAKINYDPETMLNVIGVLKNQELFAIEQAKANGGKAAAGYHGVFSSHPDNDQRLQGVIRAAKKYQTAAPEKIDPRAYMELSNGMAFGSSESQGIVRKNHFYHKPLNFHVKFPSGWSLSNQPDRLLGLSADKKQLIQFVLGDADAKSPESFLKKTFPKLRSGKSRGKHTYAGVSEMKTPWGQRNGRVAAVKHNGKMYVFMGVGETKDPKQQFFDTVGSLGKLNSREKKLAKGKTIKVIRAKSGDTFAKLAKQSNLDQFQVSRLRLLNGLYPSGEPTAGQYIKIVK